MEEVRCCSLAPCGRPAAMVLHNQVRTACRRNESSHPSGDLCCRKRLAFCAATSRNHSQPTQISLWGHTAHPSVTNQQMGCQPTVEFIEPRERQLRNEGSQTWHGHLARENRAISQEMPQGITGKMPVPRYFATPCETAHPRKALSAVRGWCSILLSIDRKAKPLPNCRWQAPVLPLRCL